MVGRVLLFSSGLFVLALGGWSWSVYNENQRLGLQVAELTKSIATLESSIDEAREQRVKPATHNPSAPEPVHAASASESLAAVEDDQVATHHGEASRNRSSEWKSSFYTDEVSRLVALTPEQQRLLRMQFAEAFSAPGSKPTGEYKKILRVAVGDEVADLYERARADEEREREQEALADEVFSYSRKLSLSSEQEPAVQRIVRAVNQELKPLNDQVQIAMREAMSNHSGADQDRGRLRASYDQLKSLSRDMKEAKDTALRERLKPLLSDAQYNSLLQLQASAPNRF